MRLFRTTRPHPAVALAACGFLMLAGGCGRRNFEMGSVDGRATLNGNPLYPGLVCFYDPSQGRGGGGVLNEDGSFKVVTIDGQGLRTGTYQVAVRPPFVEGVPYNAAPNPAGIPTKYFEFETSGLTVEVKEGTNDPLELTLTGKKPAAPGNRSDD